MFGELIIAVVYVPILLLEGTEGKMFRPMALTILFALVGSFILSMTLMPALASLTLHRPSQWPAVKTREELIAEIEAKLIENVPGVSFGFSQPIEM